MTGDFYRNHDFKDFVKQAITDGHYLGAHSDKHLLYNDWSKDKKRLVSYKEFKSDLDANYQEMEKFGIKKEDAQYFLPPYCTAKAQPLSEGISKLQLPQEANTLYDFSFC